VPQDLPDPNKRNAAGFNRGILRSVKDCDFADSLRPAQDRTQDGADSAVIASVIVVTTILAKTCVISLHETISKRL
jgi:hypothetical protein